MNHERIERELTILREGGQRADLITVGDQAFVLYHEVPTGGTRHGLPHSTDAIVPVPSGYPGAPIDLAGLPVGSPFLALVKGGQNNQGVHTVEGREWQLGSYHPHNGGGGPPWDQIEHGFHTYIDHLIAWLDRI